MLNINVISNYSVAKMLSSPERFTSFYFFKLVNEHASSSYHANTGYQYFFKKGFVSYVFLKHKNQSILNCTTSLLHDRRQVMALFGLQYPYLSNEGQTFIGFSLF